MRLHLASNDRQLHSLCQETFGEILGRGWTLHIAGGAAPECDADLYIWDIEPDSFAFTAVEPANRWRHFFLVDRSYIHSFRASLPYPDANIVLKPVTRAALMSFFPDACKRCNRLSFR